MSRNTTSLLIGLFVLSTLLTSGCIKEEKKVTTAEPEPIIPTPEAVSTELSTPKSQKSEDTTMEFFLKSKGFEKGENIPVKYTCDGEDLSPPLFWGAPPAGTKFTALVVDDPDAPMNVFTHWVLFNLPVSVRGLPEGVPRLDRLENGGIQGTNDFMEIGYRGPCPPPGKPHTYRFLLYALDAELNLRKGATKEEVMTTMEGHILAKAELSGKYGR